MPKEKLKIVLLGGGAVGKSSLTLRLTTGKFFEDYDPTIEDCHITTLVVDGQPVILEILDTAGQEDFHNSFMDQWIESAQGFLLVYSIESSQSLDMLLALRDRILLTNNDENFPIVLVGNKSDVRKEEKEVAVSYEDGKTLADRWGASFFEVSAKESKMLKEPFEQLVRCIRYRKRHFGGSRHLAHTKDITPGCGGNRMSIFGLCTIL
ncbi:hypothetical protein AAMO2058_000309800 [Amorphochlora amoebiformis]|uniref:Uncharacterized protein n=1 Tax=Amorphochlora amoebiformis TaxID=1561963 RepID=A0A7S0DP46_9EUKA|mmetsp:Transcript_33041/g.53091  ORF Transcript_33041/g.53091 Transcript_33041/m.53091 type:complete len:208 (+) Transcript_33041:172-795(+)